MTTNETISAYTMVKALIESGVSMAGTPLAAQLTDEQRTELGLGEIVACVACDSDDLEQEPYGARCMSCGYVDEKATLA